jgi:hypothetical protein
VSNIEKIDQAKDKKDTFNELVERVFLYISDNISNPGERLKVERDLVAYSKKNTSDWLLNLIISIHRYGQQREKEAN